MQIKIAERQDILFLSNQGHAPALKDSYIFNIFREHVAYAYVFLIQSPVDTGSKLNVHKTFRGRPGRLLNVLCTFNLRLVSTGNRVKKIVFFLNRQILKDKAKKNHTSFQALLRKKHELTIREPYSIVNSNLVLVTAYVYSFRTKLVK